jgi:hypothetical protein
VAHESYTKGNFTDSCRYFISVLGFEQKIEDLLELSYSANTGMLLVRIWGNVPINPFHRSYQTDNVSIRCMQIQFLWGKSAVEDNFNWFYILITMKDFVIIKISCVI